MLKFYTALVCCLSLFTLSYGQDLQRNTLAVPKYREMKADRLLDSVSFIKMDTGKVWMLNKIAAIYWWRRSEHYNDLDSSVHYAALARNLSNRLHYLQGTDESTFLICKALAENGKIEEAESYAAQAPRAQGPRLYLVLAEHFINLPGSLKSNLDKGLPYLSKALSLARSAADTRWTQEAEIALAKYYFLVGDIRTGTAYFMYIINYWQKAGKISDEAHWWSELGRYLPDGRENSFHSITYLKKAFSLYKSLGDKPDMAFTADDIGEIYNEHLLQLDSAQLYLTLSISLLREAGIKKLFTYYYHLSDIFLRQGNLKQALTYSLASLRNMEETGNNRMKGIVYIGLGEIYAGLGDYGNSLHYSNMAMDQLTHGGAYFIHYLAKNISDNLVVQGKPAAALQFLRKFEREHPKSYLRDQETIMSARGNCFEAMGKFKLAEKCYLKMIALDTLSVKEGMIFFTKSVAGSEAYYIISNFYVKRKRFETASRYLEKFHEIENTIPLIAKNIALLQFQVDSASGNFVSAIKNYQKYSSYKDSMYNIANTGKLAEMRIQYQTEQKDKDIKLLQKEAQLNERRILLSSQSRNFLLFSILMLGIITAIAYNRYRLKQSSYLQLESKQQEINVQNGALNSLNQRLQRLIEEKEWLIKEIHHRVKNNLQMMQSLLKSQGYYTNSGDAAVAIQTSQHRMQAMALVHQKLYLDDGMDSINMQDYVQELVSYLKSSFDHVKNIEYLVHVAPIQMDTVRAVPLGLIINECVTNAIKYAFINAVSGLISISLFEDQDQYLLIIEDNGKGLPKDFNRELNQSFGMTLINGLARQLDGQLSLSGNDGLKVSIVFKQV